MRIGIVGDTHLGSTDYSRKRRADFSVAFINALDACVARNVEVICLLGDVFDSAATRRNVDGFAEVVSEISQTLTALKRAGLPVVAIPGNHEFGRGREAGELSVLEYLGFVHVLRGTTFATGNLSICGIPWQSRPEEVAQQAGSLLRDCRSPRKILLMHNFIRGSRAIPEQLWEVDPACCEGFDRVFVGHHHVYETVGNCVMPGSTEVQNMLDVSDKCIVFYDSETTDLQSAALPRTHRVVVLKYDLSLVPASELAAHIGCDLDAQNCAGTFVYLRVAGAAPRNHSISKAEILGLLRERELFDHCIEFRYLTDAKTADESRRGASIEQILRRTFQRADLQKARQYLQASDSEKLFTDIRERILSDH